MSFLPNETDARLEAIEHHLETLTLQVARIEKALEDIAFWADMQGHTGMSGVIHRALNNLRPE